MLWVLVFMSLCYTEAKDPIVKRFSDVQPALIGPFQHQPKETECGETFVKSHNRILGGAPSVLGAWPWIGALFYCVKYLDKDCSHQHFRCSGTLVSKKHVITVAHCIKPPPLSLNAVRFGELNLDPNVDDGAHPVDVPVLNAITHPEYWNRTSPDNDIAIVTLKNPVEFTRFIRPICLPTLPELRTGTFERKNPIFAGWGYPSGSKRGSKPLFEVQITVVKQEDCVTSYKFSYLNLNQNQLCAGGMVEGVNKVPCKGDSGGPLMLPYMGKYYLIGISSFAVHCPSPSHYLPGVYTRVTNYLNWIFENIN